MTATKAEKFVHESLTSARCADCDWHGRSTAGTSAMGWGANHAKHYGHRVDATSTVTVTYIGSGTR